MTTNTNMACYISIGVAGYEIFILSPFAPFLREAGSLVGNQVITTELYSQAGSLVGNQVITTELYSLVVLHPEERQRPFRMGNVIIDGTPVYAEETRRIAYRIRLFRLYL